MSFSPFDLVHLDIWGPFSVESIEGYRYFLTLTWLYMLKDKSDISHIFLDFLKHINTQYKTAVQAIRSDNAREFSIF